MTTYNCRDTADIPSVSFVFQSFEMSLQFFCGNSPLVLRSNMKLKLHRNCYIDGVAATLFKYRYRYYCFTNNGVHQRKAVVVVNDIENI